MNDPSRPSLPSRFYRIDDDGNMTTGARTAKACFDLLDHQKLHGFTSRYQTVIAIIPTAHPDPSIIAIVRTVCQACRGEGDHGGTDYPITRCTRCNGTGHAPPQPPHPKNRDPETQWNPNPDHHTRTRHTRTDTDQTRTVHTPTTPQSPTHTRDTHRDPPTTPTPPHTPTPDTHNQKPKRLIGPPSRRCSTSAEFQWLLFGGRVGAAVGATVAAIVTAVALR